MNKEKAIIFGINSQDGFYLKSIIEAAGITVIGVSRSTGNWIVGDVADGDLVEKLIRGHKPDYIFHFAANSTTSHGAAFENHKAISNGTLNILENVYQHSKKTRVFLSGSGLQFVNNGTPIKETNPFISTSIYSAERIYSVYAARYFRQLGLKIYIGYFFHHDSPLRNGRHLNMKIIRTAFNIKSLKETFLEIGNPEVVKEYNHAYDLMRAVWCLILQDEIFEAVLGSGIGYKVMDWINICFKIVGIEPNDYIRLNPNFKSEFSSMVSNPETIKSLGWAPTYDIYQLAKDMIDNGSY